MSVVKEHSGVYIDPRGLRLVIARYRIELKHFIGILPEIRADLLLKVLHIRVVKKYKDRSLCLVVPVKDHLRIYKSLAV